MFFACPPPPTLLGRNLEKDELLAWKAKNVQLKEICFENDH
jgi:hypothetical protein